MKQILAFGDSNTWGLVPGERQLKRYPWGVRWTSLLQEMNSDYRVVEEGLCGRTTIFEDELRPGRKGVSTLDPLLESQYPVDAIIFMLGTNDCKTYYNATSYIIGKGIEKCLDAIEKYVPAEKILLISPMLLGEDVWHPEKDPEFGKQSIAVSKELKKVYGDIAKRRGTAFLAASDHVKASAADDEHMDEAGHKIFAEVVSFTLSRMGV